VSGNECEIEQNNAEKKRLLVEVWRLLRSNGQLKALCTGDATGCEGQPATPANESYGKWQK
jgi:hypothetical protein